MWQSVVGNIVYLGILGAHYMASSCVLCKWDLGFPKYWIACHTTTIGTVIDEDWIRLPIQFLFQDEEANLVPVVDTLEIRLYVLGGEGWFRSVLLNGFFWIDVEVGRKILCREEVVLIGLLALCLVPKKDEKSLFAIA